MARKEFTTQTTEPIFVILGTSESERKTNRKDTMSNETDKTNPETQPAQEIPPAAPARKPRKPRGKSRMLLLVEVEPEGKQDKHLMCYQIAGQADTVKACRALATDNADLPAGGYVIACVRERFTRSVKTVQQVLLKGV